MVNKSETRAAAHALIDKHMDMERDTGGRIKSLVLHRLRTSIQNRESFIRSHIDVRPNDEEYVSVFWSDRAAGWVCMISVQSFDAISTYVEKAKLELKKQAACCPSTTMKVYGLKSE